MDKLRVQFSGGLGNQLFTYTAFRHYADAYDLELTIDCSVVERVIGRQADILSFALDSELFYSNHDVSLVGDYLNRISWRNSLTRKMFNRMLYPSINDEFDLKSSSKASWNRGFFQTSTYFELISPERKNSLFKLREESNDFKNLAMEIARAKPIAIHVRRGDYRGYQTSFGLLDSHFFKSGINELERLYGERPIWLFSDEPDAVEDEFRGSNISISKRIHPSALNSSETLKLMSLAYAHVISNSTFSWWAGALSEQQKVVYPEPWFKTNDGWLSNDNLSLPNWISQNATWR